MSRARPLLVALGLLSVGAAGITAASAQNINQRKTAPPPANSKISRVVALAELQSKQDGGNSLRKDELTVTHECGTVSVGGTGAGKEAPRRSSLVGTNLAANKESVVNAENIVNICR